MSLSNTLLLRLPDWYKIITTVATNAVLKGVSGVAQQKMRPGYFTSQVFASEAVADGLQGHRRGQRVRSMLVPRGHLHVLEESFVAVSGFSFLKLLTVVHVP